MNAGVDFAAGGIVLSEEKILLVQKITENIALLLDVQAEQKEVTSQKILEALVVFQSKKTDFSISDLECFFFLTVIFDLN